MKVTVAEVAFTEEKTSKAGKQYTLTTFKDETGKLYRDVYGKLNQGDVVEGEWKKDNYGNDKFEITRPASGGFGAGRAQDPATRASIERQSALKAAVEAVHDYHELHGLLDGSGIPIPMKTYITEIVNVANVFAQAIGGANVKPQPTPEPGMAPEPQGEIDPNDIPF